MLEESLELLSKLTVYSKYARYLPELKRRESWEEIVQRNIDMHVKKFPFLEEEIYNAFSFVYNKQCLPSMRSFQFAGAPIELNASRLYNCSALPVDSYECFQEIMFLLLSGCGVGYSVQHHHIKQLPDLVGPNKRHRRFVVGDSIVGWADAVKVLMKSYFFNKPQPVFDFSDIRKKGTPLKTSGGIAPGAEPLKKALFNIQTLLDSVIEERGANTKLKPIEAHDIICHISDCVLAGGIRRASCICLFSYNDEDMLSCKSGNWYEINPQRARSNNSVVLLRHTTTKEMFESIWDRIVASGFGEPGVYFSNSKDTLVNPCNEASLNPYSFCNLTTINVSDVESQNDLNLRVKAAAFIGTLQASYTDFHYLRDIWKTTTEEDALLGISMTGIASSAVFNYDCTEAALVAEEENKRVSSIIGINSAKRLTLLKPEGSSSCLLGTSSGIHPWHSKYYIRRMRFNKEEPVYKYLLSKIPKLVEDDIYKPTTDAVVSIPIKSPEGALLREDVNAINQLELVRHFHSNWILPGHNEGENTHNVSVTVSVRDHEWNEVGDWLWNNRHSYNGVAILPFDGGNYTQAPFEEIEKDRYNNIMWDCGIDMRSIDLLYVKEEKDLTQHKDIVACAGGKCDIV